MRLLVSGDDAVGVVDWATATTEVVRMPPAYGFEGAAALGSDQAVRTFGLSWHRPAGILVACHERVGVLGPRLDHRRFLDISPLWFMTHAIAVRDGVLYTCNARVDVVGVHDLVSGDERFLDVGRRSTVPNPQHLKPLGDGYAHDRHHPNAVVVTDEHLYVLTHPFDASRVWSRVVIFDRVTLAPVGTVDLDERPLGVPYAHDLAVVDGSVLWCDTFRGRVRASDGRSSEVLGDGTTFLRGLAVDGSWLFAGVVSRRGTPAPTAHVVRLDASTFEEVDRVAVPFPVEICAVRIADGPDLAHPGAGPAPLSPAAGRPRGHGRGAQPPRGERPPAPGRPAPRRRGS